MALIINPTDWTGEATWATGIGVSVYSKRGESHLRDQGGFGMG